ncbi:MAG: ABC transporter substrate-binding protein [Desulfatitalea sp.]
MRFSTSAVRKKWRSYPWRVLVWMVGWFLLISAFHFSLNSEHERRKIVQMGYMPVITNLAAPLLDAASAQLEDGIRFKAMKFSSFAEMAEALRNDKIQAAFIIAPLSIVLNQQGEDVRVVYIGNRHESTFVTRKELGIKSIVDLEGRTVAVPMRYSGHNLALLKLISEAGLKDRVRVVEMNPPDMASALASGALDAYFVGEPFAAQTLKFGKSNLFLYVEQVWPNFICNLLLVKQRLIDREPATVQALVEGAARSGLWAQNNIAQAAQVASRYWGQPVELVEYALNTPEHRIQFDKFVPHQEEMQQMADLMVRFGLIKENTIAGLVEDRFARQADLDAIGEMDTILRKKP